MERRGFKTTSWYSEGLEATPLPRWSQRKAVAQADGTVATRQERYTVTVPLPPEGAYAALKGLLGRDITEEEKSNAQGVYTLAAMQRQ
mgnify:CR=1 FL=1